MPTYGLSTEGFAIKTIDILRDEISAALRSAFGASIDTGDKSILGQLIGIIAERLVLLWELAEAVNSSQDPDKANGAALEALAALTGTFRASASYSTVDLILTGDDGTNVTSGKQVQTASTAVGFITTTDAAITLVSDWVGATPYVLGDRRKNNDRVYQVTVAGTSAGSGGPTGTDAAIVDNTVTWTYLGEGEGAGDCEARAAETGAVTGFSRDITTIVTSAAGWESVINLLDATEGREIATDSELRLLREQELAAGGSTTINALRAELLEVPNVVAATIFVNNTDLTDVDGIPPHSVEALIRPTALLEGDPDFEQSIWDQLLESVAAGIRTHGEEEGTATDDEGTEHTMKFTYPENLLIYVSIAVTKDPDEYPIDGDEQIKQAIVDWGDAQNTGKNVVATALIAQAFTVPGVLDVTICYIDTAPGPTTSTTIPVSLRQLAVYDTSRVFVLSSDGTP